MAQAKRKTKEGLYQVGSIPVDSGQLVFADPCNAEKINFDIISNKSIKDLEKKKSRNTIQVNNCVVATRTNFGDGLYPVFECYEQGERVGIFIPLETELHQGLKELVKTKKGGR